MTALWILLATLFVAYANGANDNFKGVATLFGSGTTDYRKALGWATLTTFAGSLASLWLATRLVGTFGGEGLVPDQVVQDPFFVLAVGLGAALTVFLASQTGIPISTTHALTGALVGSGWVAIGGQLGVAALKEKFFIPLLASPFLALFLTVLIYPLFKAARRLSGVTKESCLCVGGRLVPVGALVAADGRSFSSLALPVPEVKAGRLSECAQNAVEVYSGKFFGITAQRFLDICHFLSAGAVSFARGLNDTPKIVALLITAEAFDVKGALAGVAVAMAVGGILKARKVAQTVSKRITPMNHGQGFSANLVTALLVIAASRWGMPVSTTHVSCGSLFGLGLASGRANWRLIGGILSAWVFTLPLAALFSGALYRLFGTT